MLTTETPFTVIFYYMPLIQLLRNADLTDATFLSYLITEATFPSVQLLYYLFYFILFYSVFIFILLLCLIWTRQCHCDIWISLGINKVFHICIFRNAFLQKTSPKTSHSFFCSITNLFITRLCLCGLCMKHNTS